MKKKPVNKPPLSAKDRFVMAMAALRTFVAVVFAWVHW